MLQGKQVRHGITVETAIKEWWQFRGKNGLGKTKAKLMGQKLIDWCQENDVLLITALTTDRVMKFRMSLPFRTGDSTSLKVHWSVIGGFLSWAAGMGYIDKTPIPNARQFPQFKIVLKKKEVKPPTAKQVEKALAAATGRVRVLCELMRWSAMALVDAQKFGISREDAEKFGLSQPERSPVPEDGTLVRTTPWPTA